MKRRQPWFVYIVRCRDGTLYTGITTDLLRRVRQHNAGKASRYSRCRLPVVLVYSERALTRSSALRREAALKALTRSEKEQLIRQAA
jgi:predicted GIY-YIG superfamily endonuclease